MIINISSALEILSESFEKSMRTIRKNYVVRVVKNIIFKLNRDVMGFSVSPDNEDGITSYWNRVENAISSGICLSIVYRYMEPLNPIPTLMRIAHN